MAPDQDLRIAVDGDSAKVYHRGDKVTGTVIFAVGEEIDIRSLVLNFMGAVTTATARPFYVTGNDADAAPTMRNYEERVTLFNIEKELLPRCTLDSRKRSWTFEFTFPGVTIPKYSRFQHGPKYYKDPHPLPPSFQTYTDSPGGSAAVSYFLKATLTRNGAQKPSKFYHILPYHPTPENLDVETRVVPRVLYAQTWKPLSENQKTVDKALSLLSRRNTNTPTNPRLVPTVHCPEKVTPGKHIPIILSLIDSNSSPDPENSTQNQYQLESVKISIGTYTTSMCGHPASQPEDTMSKHVTCIDRKNINNAVTFGTQVNLTNNFRLVDDAECVPSFKTYTITRRYDLTIAIGIKYKDRTFTIRNTTALEILPRVPRNLLHSTPETEDVEDDPLPLYTPREPSKELAPDYFSIYGHTSAASNSSSASLASSQNRSRGSSVASGLSTPASEFGQLALDECPVYTP
ncbi:hypothetical protein DM02DRAFT_595470 [Periconia macrospinosa]|uniref:Arrestin-like N-terminal domain-containing protein n=1 Tax=Periconia macrospinosa TaxID=97972 RepID=A0A2V1DLR2_9PLEO|nr:hypothetical protein DM02DRAFT_595470 [Periconia macrospinosa]